MRLVISPHPRDTLVDMKKEEVRPYCSKPVRGPRRWEGEKAEQAAVCAIRRRIRESAGLAITGYLLLNPIMNTATTRTARPADMTLNAFWPAPRHSPVKSPQRVAMTTVEDM